jgi:uracil-DNA glycosylase family 4
LFLSKKGYTHEWCEKVFRDSKKTLLAKLNQEIINCRRCPLWESATNAVPGEGNPYSEIVFIGEAPGFYEDKQGKPFVGAAGRLLNKLLEEIKLSREEVFICNVLKHRPPGNRNPLPEEISACRYWLERQLEIIAPKLVVTLGRFSLFQFIPDGKVSRLNGQPQVVGELLVFPLYHPAAALRSSGIMKEFRAGFYKIPDIMANLGFLLAQGDGSRNQAEVEDSSDEQQLSLI